MSGDRQHGRPTHTMDDDSPRSKEYDQPRDHHDGRGGMNRPGGEDRHSHPFVTGVIGPSIGFGIISLLFGVAWKVQGDEWLGTKVGLLGIVLIAWPFVLFGVLAALQTIIGWFGDSND